MTNSITCPTCGMSASVSDHRLLVPLPVNEKQSKSDDVDLRGCRNCGATLDAADAQDRASCQYEGQSESV